MKRTIYHIGEETPHGQLSAAIDSACKKRDEWIATNRDKIGDVHEEDLIIIQLHQDRSRIIATIKYTYYPAET